MSSNCNQSVFYQRPDDSCIDNHMKLTQTNLISIGVYSALFLLSSMCNLFMITYFCVKPSRLQHRVNQFMFHLNIADLIITFITIPLEIGWKWTVYWVFFGDFGCRFLQFLRPIGIYLASFIIISLCIDRYCSIVYPLSSQNSLKRTRVLIALSWTLSIFFSIPQIFVFSLKVHPKHKWYTQCLDYKFNANPVEDPHLYKIYQITFLIYQIIISILTFFLPLIVIIFTYTCILLKIIRSRHSFQTDILLQEPTKRKREDSTLIHAHTMNRENTMRKASRKTIKLVFLIVIVFLVSWTPYYTISVIFWIYPESAAKIDDRIYNFLFIFAVSNSLANPLVFGLTSIKFKLRCKKSVGRS